MKTCPHCQHVLSADATAVERRVILLLAEGLCRKEIAQVLEMAPKTVDSHLYNLHRRWAIRKANPVKLLREAIRRGIFRYEGDQVVERMPSDAHVG